MKIEFNKKKLKELAPYLVMGSITVGVCGAMSAYYLADNFKNNIVQVGDSNINMDDMEVLDNGEMYYLFSEGEHKVKMSHNDAWYREIEQVEGYEIINVEVNGWRDNSQVTFVNKVPVKVKLTGSESGKLKFDDFGEVFEEEKAKSK